ncbi:hypothetical protein AGDE_16637 [Angomonas deanei]|uniref:Palmitoyltransferase n=1 Tax=Angomonas deanei TaxID=59799 RepID=A0A7G2CW63_9TRYP|nr:hypothetical protein AGDE_16637 [Angomonas deanei]CAD2222673.1 DHHC palmitoyltransferase, putative [Angomonas deanei]|eukprot:EPY16728.1 hypothetical protein AGDE_16637 [Angomonas deanei]
MIASQSVRSLVSPKNFAEAVQGPSFLMRLRDPANLCAFLCLVFLQIVIFAGTSPSKCGGSGLTSLPWQEVLNSYKWENRDKLSLPQDSLFYRFGKYDWFACDKVRKHQRWPYFFGCVTLFFLFVTKKWWKEGVLRRAAVELESHDKSETLTGPLSPSVNPIWQLTRERRFNVFNNKRVCSGTVLLPGRTYYCQERDVFIKGYDNYSMLLDTPIGVGNRRSFVYFIIAAFFLQCSLLHHGTSVAEATLQCRSAELTLPQGPKSILRGLVRPPQWIIMA